MTCPSYSGRNSSLAPYFIEPRPADVFNASRVKIRILGSVVVARWVSFFKNIFFSVDGTYNMSSLIANLKNANNDATSGRVFLFLGLHDLRQSKLVSMSKLFATIFERVSRLTECSK